MRGMGNSTCLNDATIGPFVRGCRGDFDFTIRYEQVFFAIVPTVLFTVCSIPRIIWLSRKPRIVLGSAQRFLRLMIIVVLATLEFALLNLLTMVNSPSTDKFDIAATATQLLAAVALLCLSFLEYSKAPKPSMLITLYMLVQIMIDMARLRTIWMMPGSLLSNMHARLFTASVIIKCIILIAESQSKTRRLRWDIQDHSPEETSGVLSLSVYFWLNRLFLQGYRSILTNEDLYPLDHGMRSELLHEKLEKVTKTAKRGRKLGLARSLAKSLLLPCLMPVLPRLLLTGFTFSQPFFIGALLKYLEQDESPQNIGFGLIGAAFLIYTGIAALKALYLYFLHRLMNMCRGCLCAAIYRKTTKQKLVNTGDAAALTLMSTDIERIVLGFESLHEFWAGTIEVGLGCWLLQKQLGASFIAPIVLVLFCTAFTAWVGAYVGKRQSDWMAKIEKRVGLTSNIISNMKNLKLSGMTLPMGDFIQKMRKEELHIGNRYRWLLTLNVMFAFSSKTLSPVVAFAFTGRDMDTTTLFSSFSYLVLLSAPIFLMIQYVPAVLAAFTCLGRIQDYLEKDPQPDFREKIDSNIIDEKSTQAFSVDDSTQSEKISDPSQSGPSGNAMSGIVVKDGSFGWAREKMILKNLNINFPISRFTFVIGPVASGKSTLCNALLGEVPYFSGKLIMPIDRSAIGYCEQKPFLSNDSIKDNIIGYSMFNQIKYDEIVEACMLKPDLATLPQGDETQIGTNGIVLSGGQKQRVSLARALYLESRLLVLDDVLSGLDNDTANELVRRVFGASGILRRRAATVILCTHAVQHLPLADQIIALGPEGTVVQQGILKEILQNKKYAATLSITEPENHMDQSSPNRSVDVTTTIGTEAKPRSAVANILGSDDLQNASRQMGDSKIYLYYFRASTMISVVASFAISFLMALCNHFPTIWMKFWSEDTFDESSTFYVAIFSAIKVCQLICVFMLCFAVFIWLTTQSGANLHLKALETVVHAPLQFFSTTDLGVITNLFSQDMTLIDGVLPGALLNTMICLCEVVVMAAVIASSSPYMTISYPFLSGLLWIVQKFYLRTSRQMRLLDLEAKSPLYTHYLDTISGVSTIRAFGWVDQHIAHNQKLLDTSQRPAYLLSMIQNWLTLTMSIIVMVLAVIVVTLATQTRANSGLAGASLVTLMSLGESMTYVIQAYTSLETSIGAVSRIKSFSEKVVPEDLTGEDIEPEENWPEESGIEIKGVSASYNSNEAIEPSPEKTDTTSSSIVLKDLDISILPGQKVAICGRSGSGKSSLILLLLRLLEPLPSCAENMEVGSIPLHRIDRSTLRRRLLAVPQDAVFLPNGSTIKENLDPHSSATDLECHRVLDLVQLTSFVDEHEGSIHSGMSAESLSAGQKQLFSLGRAILRRRIKDRKFGNGRPCGGILLLDEVNSSVDRETERAMQEIIKKEFAEYTIVMVSHRLDMVMDFFDEVIVMEKGMVVEKGNPKALVDQDEGYFKSLWAYEGQRRS